MSLPRPTRRLRSASLVVLALLAPTPLLAAGVSGRGVSQLQPGVEPAAPLASALDSVQTGNIRADIYFIACDDLQGRYTPSPGLRIAARYIRSRLERLGFEPGAPEGFFYHYPLTRQVVDQEASSVTFEAAGTKRTLQAGRDFYYRYPSFWADMTFTGPVVFCAEGGDKDLEELELEDAWALILDDGEGAWRASRGARRAGALGSILVPTADFEGESYAERLGPSLEKAREGSYSFPRKDDDGEGGGRRRRMRLHPQLYMTREAGLELLATAPGRPEGDAGADWLPPVGTKLAATVTDERRLADQDEQLMVENVCGFWRGSDPELSKEVLIVSAHYDHVGTQGGEIHNGADDNGSGTTGLLAVAEALAHYGPMRRSVLLIWVSGEERGLWGSRAWSESPWLPEGCKPVANLNIDMIGRNASDQLMITPTKEHDQYNFIVDVAQRMAPQEGFEELSSADEFYHRSDQAMFASLGIPVAFLFSGLHDDYHEPTDDPDKVDCDKIRRVVRLVVRLLDALQGDTLEIAAAEPGK